MTSPKTTLSTGRQKLFGHLAMLLFSMLIAMSFSFGHQAAPFIPAAALNSIRFILGTLVLLIFCRVLLRPAPARPTALWRFAILGGLMSIYFVLMFKALKISDPISTGAVFTLIPLMAMGFGWLLLRQTTNLVVISTLVIGGAGALWLIFRGDVEALLAFDVGKGEIIFFFGCMAHALYVPFVKMYKRDEPLLQFSLYTVGACAIWITLAALPDLFSIDWLALPPLVWYTIAYLATFTTAATMFLLQYASVRLPASKVLAYGYLTPAFIILTEGLLGHGWVPWHIMIGAPVAALALVVMAFAADS